MLAVREPDQVLARGDGLSEIRSLFKRVYTPRFIDGLAYFVHGLTMIMETIAAVDSEEDDELAPRRRRASTASRRGPRE